MGTILLTDDEYNYIKSQLDDLTGKIETASPRAATHFSQLATLHLNFLAKEDSKRTLQQAKVTARAAIDQKRQARRAAQLQAAQQRTQQKAASASQGAAQTQSAQGGRGSKAS